MKVAINCQEWKKYLINADNHLANSRSKINTLNFFPVPDADTGTNMYLTFNGGVEAIKDYKGDSIKELSLLLSENTLYCAKGNSGVILSQIISAWCKVFGNGQDITPILFSKAVIKAKAMAYGAILKPVEGTILTVISAAASFCTSYLSTAKKHPSDWVKYFTDLTAACNAAANKTKEMMPDLNTQHLIDSGAFGLFKIFQAFELMARGITIERNKTDLASATDNEEIVHDLTSVNSFGYCTEFFIQLHEGALFDRTTFCKEIEELNCNSIVCFENDGKVKLHAHTLQPGELLTHAQTLGSLDKIKIDNMSLQALTAYKVNQDKKPKADIKLNDYGFLVFARGQGIVQYLDAFSLDYIAFLHNSSELTNELIDKAISTIYAKKIFVFPNSVYVYDYIAKMLKQSPKLKTKIVLLPCFNVVHCLQMMFIYDHDDSFTQLKDKFKGVNDNLNFAEILIPAQMQHYNHINKISSKEKATGKVYYRVGYNKFVADKDFQSAIEVILKEIVNESTEILTIIYGSVINSVLLQQIKDLIENKHQRLELDLIYGQQVDNAILIGAE